MVITSRALIFEPSGKLFVVKHTPEQSYWALPGGKLDAGENTLSCFHREMHEELGLTNLDPKLHFIVEAPQINRLEFFYSCTIPNPESLLTSDGHMAFELADRTFLYPTQTSEQILPAFLHRYSQSDMEQMSQPVYLLSE